jgi:peroxiredoxin
MRRSSRSFLIPLGAGAAAALLLASSPRAAAQETPPGPAAPPPAAAASGKLEVGATAPDFTLKDQDGKPVTLSSFRGRRSVVLAFYPRAMTAGCTREMKILSAEWRKVDARGAEVLGISGDPVEKAREFATAVGTRFPLLSDPDFAVAKAYGVYTASPDGGFAARSVFLVDREGKLRWIERDFVPPRTLEGSVLLQQVDLLKPAVADPTDVLATLPSPEKEAKTVFARYVQALLAEDPRAVDKLLHRDFGTRPGSTAAMVQQRRDAEVDRLRKLFDAHDVKALAFADVADVRDGRVLAKGDHEKPGVLAGYTDEAKKAAAEVAEGDLLLVARTKAPKVGDQALLPREILLTLRKEQETWKIAAIAGR